MKFKDCNLQVKDVTSDGIVTMYVSSFDNEDSDGDIITRGAFTKTINEMGVNGSDRIAHLYQHDVYTPIGRPLEMVEDDHGLLVRSQVSDIRNGDFRKMYEQEVIREHSIGFHTIQESYSSSLGANIIKEVKLWEYSSVTFGANPDTWVVSKSMDNAQMIKFAEERMKRCSKALRQGTFTDETMHLFEVEIKNLTDIIISLAKESHEEVHSKDQPIIDSESFTEKFNKYYNQN